MSRKALSLNKAQGSHLADTLRILAIAQFGVFGYHGMVHWKTDSASTIWTLLWSVAMFIFLEAIALRALKNEAETQTTREEP